MPSASPRRSCHIAPRLLSLLTVTMLASCVDGKTPVELPSESSQALLALDSQTLNALQSEGAPEIVRIRVVGTVFGENEGVGFTEVPVEPDASSWTVEVEITLPPGQGPQIELTIELMSASLTVEWSGHVGPLTVVPGETMTVSSVVIFRGPLDNLGVTALSILGPTSMRANRSTQLFVTAHHVESGANPVIYWTSLTPGIGEVSETGLFQALAPGTAQVQATAGPATETRQIEVLPALDRIVITPPEYSFRNYGDFAEFQATVFDVHENVVEDETVNWTVDDPDREVVDYNPGESVFTSVGDGTATVTASVEAEPEIRATAQVHVRQLADFVDVLPVEYTLEEAGQSVQFSADPHDAHGNPVWGATFEWESADPSVATVDQTGLATAQGGGTTWIWVKVVEPANPPGEAPTTGHAVLTVDLPLDFVLSPGTALLESLGEQTTLTPLSGTSGEPVTDITFTWTSSDPSVATVDPEGVVTAVADGEATITATGEGQSASAVITVLQTVAALNWIVQPPSEAYYSETFYPAPTVEALDARGNRVTSFDGVVTVRAFRVDDGVIYDVMGGTPSISAYQGLAEFDNIRIDDFGHYRLRAEVSIPGVPTVMSNLIDLWG